MQAFENTNQNIYNKQGSRIDKVSVKEVSFKEDAFEVMLQYVQCDREKNILEIQSLISFQKETEAPKAKGIFRLAEEGPNAVFRGQSGVPRTTRAEVAPVDEPLTPTGGSVAGIRGPWPLGRPERHEISPFLASAPTSQVPRASTFLS